MARSLGEEFKEFNNLVGRGSGIAEQESQREAMFRWCIAPNAYQLPSRGSHVTTARQLPDLAHVQDCMHFSHREAFASHSGASP